MQWFYYSNILKFLIYVNSSFCGAVDVLVVFNRNMVEDLKSKLNERNL